MHFGLFGLTHGHMWVDYKEIQGKVCCDHDGIVENHGFGCLNLLFVGVPQHQAIVEESAFILEKLSDLLG